MVLETNGTTAAWGAVLSCHAVSAGVDGAGLTGGSFEGLEKSEEVEELRQGVPGDADDARHAEEAGELDSPGVLKTDARIRGRAGCSAGIGGFAID